MNSIKGKNLIVMDNTSLGACAVKRAKELGVHTIVANFYPYEKSASKQVADEYVDIDISDIDAMVKLVKDKHIDGIFIGWTDSHLPFYAKICKKANLPCVGTEEMFETLSNDKTKFKACCEKYGVPVPKTYKVDLNFNREDLDKIEYPVIVKPADESGSRGIRKCVNEAELIENFTWSYNRSQSKKVFVEQYIESDEEVFIHYTVQNGYYSLSSAFMKHRAKTENGFAASAILHTFPIPQLDLYRETAEPKIIDMMKGLGLQYGAINFQGSVQNGKFYFYESGFRMGGEQHYVFGNVLNGVSSLDLMIEFSLTGKMESASLKELDNPYYSKSCVNYYVTLRPGTISNITGIDEVRKMPQVLQVLTFKKVGDVILPSQSLDRVIYRLHVMDDTPELLSKTLEKISHTIRIFDENNNEMQLEELGYERALQMIDK